LSCHPDLDLVQDPGPGSKRIQGDSDSHCEHSMRFVLGCLTIHLRGVNGPVAWSVTPDVPYRPALPNTFVRTGLSVQVAVNDQHWLSIHPRQLKKLSAVDGHVARPHTGGHVVNRN
jgi:hypothetical protein